MTGEYSISEVKVPRFFIDKTILQSAIQDKFLLKVLAVVRLELDIDAVGNPLNRQVMHEPDDNFVLQSGDTLFILGTNEKIAEFRNM